MYLIFNNILIVKSSCEIILFKLQPKKKFKKAADASFVELEWVKYHTIDIIGFIYFRQGDDKFQLITDKLVYFYSFEEGPNGEINPIPKLDNIMYNFMACTTFMVDGENKLVVTYKSGQPNLQIYRRKFDHGF